MKIFSIENIRLILIIGFVAFVFSFTARRNEKRKINKSEVIFVEEKAPFLKERTVNKLLIENKKDVSTIQKDSLDLNKIENSINSNEMVKKTDVFITIDGLLKAVVVQKTPIARVFDQGGSYYIDYEGGQMPLSANYTARVPLVFGDINQKNIKELAEIFQKIYDDDFLKKNIIAIEIMPNGGIKMMNRNFNFVIDFGGVVNVDSKFRKYKAFFQKTTSDSVLLSYKKVDLRFMKQVVCTK